MSRPEEPTWTSQSCAPPVALGGPSFLSFRTAGTSVSLGWGRSHQPCLPSAYLWVSACSSPCPPLFYRRQPLDLGPVLIQYDLISTELIKLQSSYFQIRSCSVVLGRRELSEISQERDISVVGGSGLPRRDRGLGDFCRRAHCQLLCHFCGRSNITSPLGKIREITNESYSLIKSEIIEMPRGTCSHPKMLALILASPPQRR